MPFNGSGVFSLAEAPFVPGTTIVAADMNSDLSDIATGLSTCLTTDGQSTMTAPIKGASGTVSLPGYAFAADPNTGIYRIGVDNIGIACNGTKIVDISTSGVLFTPALATGALADNSVTYAKIQEAAGAGLMGATSATEFQLITLGNGLEFSGSTLTAVAQLPLNYIAGCTLSNNVTDATNDIDIATGVCRDYTNTVDIEIQSAFGKQLDANWTAGGTPVSPVGMRNSAAGITDTTYHIYAGRTAASPAADIYAHTSADPATVLTAWQAETGGASYAYLRRIGSIMRVSSSIVTFVQLPGGNFRIKSPILSINAAAQGATATLRALTVPLGIKVLAEANIWWQGTGSSGTLTRQLYISCPDVNDENPSSSAAPLSNLSATVAISANNVTDLNIGGRFREFTDTSGQWRFDASAAITLYGATVGWQDFFES